MQPHSFFKDSLAFLHFPFWKEIKIWNLCAFATSPQAAFISPSTPGSEFAQFLFAPLFSRHSCPSSSAHTPLCPAVHRLSPLPHLPGCLRLCFPPGFPPASGASGQQHRRERIHFQVWSASSSPHYVWSLIAFVGSHAWSPIQSNNLREASSIQQGFLCFYLTRQSIDGTPQLETLFFSSFSFFQPHRLDVIQKPHTDQARF